MLYRAASSRGFHQVLAYGRQPSGVGEAGYSNVAEHLLCPTHECRSHRAISADGDAECVVGDCHRRLQQRSVGGDNLPGRGKLETAVAGIGEGSIGLQDLEETVPADGYVKRVLGRDHVPLGMVLFGGDHSHTRAQHQPGRGDRIGRSLATHLSDILVEQVFENSPFPLEPGCIDVCQVVRYHAHPRVLRVEACFGYPH